MAEAALKLLTWTWVDTDNVLDKLIINLDDLFLKEVYQSAYITCVEFEEYQRSANTFIKTYINDFEKVKAFKIELPDPVSKVE